METCPQIQKNRTQFMETDYIVVQKKNSPVYPES